VLRARPAGRQHDGRSSVPEYRWRAENNLRQIKSLIELCLNWQWEYSPMRRAVHSTQHPASKSRSGWSMLLAAPQIAGVLPLIK